MPTRAAKGTERDDRAQRMRFRRAPLAAAAVAFGLGIALAQFSTRPLPVLLAALGLLLFLTVLAMVLAARVAVAPVLGVWLVMGMLALGWAPAPPAPVALLGYADGLSRTVRGRVVRVRPPVPRTPAATADADAVPPWESTEETTGPRVPPFQVDLALDAIEDVSPDLSRMVPVAGGVRLAVYPDALVGPSALAGPAASAGAVPALGCGDRVELAVRLHTPARFRDPGAFQYADLLLREGIAAEGGVEAGRVERLGPSPPNAACRLAAAQSWASGRLRAFTASPENQRLPPLLRLSATDTSMLDAMLFGDRSGLTHGLRVGFERTGTFHLFVVSGLHIALLAAGVFWMLRRLRVPGSLATLLTLAATAGYAALTGFGQPAQRALLMISVFLLARLFSRHSDALNAIGAAALAMLVWAPSTLFDASFQMTLLAVGSILGIAVPLAEASFLPVARAARMPFRRRDRRLAPRRAQLVVMLELWGEAVANLLGGWSRTLPARMLRAALWALELALIGVVAELVMVLPMAMYFHRAAVFALPANMLVVPLLGLLAPAAVATFAASLVNPWLALVPGALTSLLLHGVRLGVTQASRLQAADVRIPGPVWWVALLAVAGWALCCWAARRSRGGALAAALALPVLAALVLWPEPALTTPGRLEITAIDVGQGDSLLAVSPAGRTMLIDAGGPVGSHGVAEIVSSFDVGEEVVSPYLWTRRMRRLDVLVLSHAHTDHMGGMPAVLENFRPRELWVGIDPASPLYDSLLAKAASLGIPVRHLHAGDVPAWDPAVATEVLAPAPGYRNPGSPRNDDSLVLRMRFGKASVLLEGDAERPSEDAMLASGRLAPVTLLKVGHHGSKTSTNPEFLAAVQPREAVISVGRRNTFGHPRAEVIGRFAALGTHLFRTDRFGLTTFLLGPDGTVREQVDGVELKPAGAAPMRSP